MELESAQLSKPPLLKNVPPCWVVLTQSDTVQLDEEPLSMMGEAILTDEPVPSNEMALPYFPVTRLMPLPVTVPFIVAPPDPLFTTVSPLARGPSVVTG